MESALIRPVEKIALLKISALGDIVWTIPLYYRLRASYPQAQIYWICGRAFAPLIADLPGVQVVPVEKPRGWKNFRSFLHTINQHGPFDLLYCAQTALRMNLAVPLIGATTKIGFASWRDGHRLVIDRAVGQMSGHMQENLLSLHPSGSGALCYDLNWQPHDYQELAQMQFDYGKSWILAPCASHPQRSLPQKLCGPLIVQVARQTGRMPILLGSAQDQDSLEAIAQWVAQSSDIPIQCRVAAGRLSLKAVALLLSRVDAPMVAPDSGLVHLAAAVGAKTVGLYAAVSADFTGPYGQQTQVVDGYDRARWHFLKQAARGPGNRLGSRRIHHPELMSLFTVEEVVAKFLSLL